MSSKYQNLFFQLGSIVFLGVIVFTILQIAGKISEIIYILGVSVLISYLLIGIVDWITSKLKTFKKFKHARAYAVIIVYLIILLIATILTVVILPEVAKQATLLANKLPIYANEFINYLKTWQLNNSTSSIIDKLSIDLNDIIKQTSTTLGGVGSKFLDFAFDTIGFAFFTFTALVVSFYILLDGPSIWIGLMRPLCPQWRHHSENIRHNLSRCLRGYFVGQVQLSSISGIYLFIIYLFVIPKYALLLATIQIVLEIIPVIGGILGIIPAIFIIWFQNGPAGALIVLGLYVGYTQIIKDNILTPRIMANAINLHPIIILLVVLAGAKLGGLTGIIFALPIAGIINVIFEYIMKIRERPALIENTK